MKTVLSIDFDFWVPIDPLLDYGHRESDFFIEAVWHSRASGYLAHTGKSLEDELRIAPTEMTDPMEMADWLSDEKRWELSQLQRFAIAESHSCAHDFFKEQGPIHLINIDAHHDIWYEMEKLNCDNWIGYLINQGVVRKLTHVYPSWRDEKKFHRDYDWPEDLQERIDKWAKKGVEVEVLMGLEQLSEDLAIEQAFICRSGAWVPPWLDQDFLDLVDGFTYHLTDDTQILAYMHGSLEEFERSYDREGVIAHADAIRTVMKPEFRKLDQFLQGVPEHKD